MLGKILFTIGVILLVALIWRTRNAPLAGSRGRSQARLVNPPRAPRWPVRSLALAVVVLLIAGSGLLLYDYWRDRTEVIYIRVVDASSGRSAEYRAQRGAISDRAFTTVDGRHIVLAETERLETSTISSPSLRDQN